MERNVYLKLTDVDEARTRWFDALEAGDRSPLAVEEVSLEAARHRTLATPAAALLSSPAFHGAAMDGIAVKASDTFGASQHRPKTLRINKEAFWINTGQPLPQGCDAVIMMENVIPRAFEPDAVDVEQAAFPWQHVRKLGEDMVATEILLPPGTVIGAYELGALAAAGILRPAVFARPRVAIIPSGSELVPLAQADRTLLQQGRQLPEFNSLILSALVRDAGGDPEVLGIVPDDPGSIAEALREAVKGPYDLVAVNAGSSAGSHDFTAHVVAEEGELLVHGVNVMPGKPTILGKVGGKPVIGVPGYPISAIIAFEEFAQPLLTLWQKRRMPRRATGAVTPFQPLPSKAGLEERIRVKLGRVGDKLLAVPLPRGAGTVTSLSRADGIIAIPPASEGIPAETPVTAAFLRTQEQIDGALLVIGSHDNTLDLLDSFLRKRFPRFSLASAHVGSMGGLTAIRNGHCHLAGSHLLDAATGVYNQADIARHLAGIPVKLVRLADREQGLIVMPGNPANITDIADLARSGVTFVNRQRGSGTRVLLDYRLSKLGISPDAIQGYENEEYTHMNVAAAVLSGRATTGLGVRAAANALGLEFIPAGVEEYDLVIPARHWDDERMQALMAVIRSAEYRDAATSMGGYIMVRTGEVVWEFAG
ncbi:MAG: molybdopterin biosynthesis protein [Desulfovibrio sp.]|jgi:putative molybdopterin biosynthesis protein|nr:molybdopterin biosynthesis protein [Desulfovibrio sp.]